MKKILAWILCAVMLVSALPAVMADGEFRIVIDSVECNPGDTDVMLTVYTENNPGWYAMQLMKIYPAELEYTGSEAGNSLIEVTDVQRADGTWGEAVVLRSLQQTSTRPKKPTDYTGDDDIAYLFFNIPADCTPGDYAVSFTVGSSNNIALQYLDDDITIVAGNIHVNGEVDASLEVGDYKGDRHQAEWLAPTQEGKVFAGWYADEAFTTVYTATTGKAYPKFVDEKVMEVKAQKLITSDPTKATLRFVSTIDSVDYQQAGFEITFNNTTVLKTVRNVYRNVTVEGVSKTPADVNGSAESQYITLYKLTNIPSSHFGANFSVSAYWMTPDGTAVYSNSPKNVNVNMFDSFE
jgi:uncharacterized repeat protein (TIGR02543 family)